MTVLFQWIFAKRMASWLVMTLILPGLVFKQYGIKVDFQPIDWSMKETELKNGTIDLLWNGYSVNPSRAKKLPLVVTI